MKKILMSAAIGTLLVSAAAVAGPGGTTCATAEQIAPNTTYTGDTSSAGYANNTNSFGPIPSPGNDAYYKFVSDGQATTTISMTASYSFGIALTSDCGNNSTLIQAANGASGSTQQLTIDNGASGPLTSGTTYYVIVTGNPTGTASDNGPFNFTTPTPLPVKLQKFSVQ